MNLKQLLNLTFAAQLFLGQELAMAKPYGTAKSYSTAAKEVKSWFASENALQGSQLTSIKTTGKNGEPIEGLMISGGKHDGYVVLSGSGKNVRMQEWKTLKNTLTKQKLNREQILRGLKGQDVLVRIGPETLGFFVALGAIQYSKMIFSPENNTLGLFQHAESQVHPLTHVSFAAFMYANGVAAPILHSLINPKNGLRSMIPYLGMSVGLLASNTVHEVSALLNGKMEKCIAEMETQIQNFEETVGSCDKAFESWSEYSMDYLVSMAPSAMSLVAATIFATSLEKFMIKKALVKAGLGILITPLVPGMQIGKALQFGRWTVGHVAGNILPFTVADELIGHPLAHSAQLYTQSSNMKHLQEKMMTELMNAKKSNWSEETSKPVLDRIVKTTFLFKEWKKLNFEPISISYSSWLSKVSELASTYNLSEFLYKEFISKAAPDVKRDSFVTLMRRPAPLYGVTQGENESSLYDNPSAVMEKQLKSIIEITSKYLETPPHEPKAEVAKSIEVARKLLALSKEALTKTEIEHTDQFFALSTEIGKIFENINARLGLQNFHPGLHPGSVDQKLKLDWDSPEYTFWKNFRGMFGSPAPLFQKGALFFTALETLPSVQSNSLALTSIEKTGGLYGLKPAQNMFLKMFFGTDPSDLKAIIQPHRINLYLIDIGTGLPKMSPPRLSLNPLDIKVLYEKDVRKWDPRIYHTLLNTPVIFENAQYENFYEMILANWSKVLSFRNEKELDSYWNDKILPTYKTAWQDLEIYYQNFVKKMFDQIRDEGRSWQNSGPLYSGALKQIELEMKYYAFILGEVIRSHQPQARSSIGKAATEQKAGNSLLPSFASDPRFAKKDFDPFWGDRPKTQAQYPLLSLLDLSSDLALFDHQPAGNLKIQDEIVADFQKLFSMVKSIRFVEQDQKGFYRIESGFKNSDIITLRDEITGKYQKWIERPSFAVSAASGIAPAALQVHQAALTSLKVLISELSNFALMANELNYVRSEGNPGRSGQQDPGCVSTAEGMRFGAGGQKELNKQKCKDLKK